jgi:XTP/dITP diphosphohydrolase
VSRLVLLVTSPRVAPGLLSADGWAALAAGPLVVSDPAAATVAPLVSAGVAVRVIVAGSAVETLAEELVAAARESGTATWLVGPDGDEPLTHALGDLVARGDGAGDVVDVEVLRGNWDLPGARLLDVVATVNRLRSQGGCPWDARQDHESLAQYLLEEAYEAFQAIEDRDSTGLREEIGDVLFQVAFHARLAEELPAEQRWSIDEVATGLVEKLVRRHPHVFAGLAVDSEAEINANWETIKAAERGDASVVANVAMAAPALTLAATLQRKAARRQTSDEPLDSLSVTVAAFEAAPSAESAGELLWAAVALMRGLDIDAEAALRARARRFRDQVTADAQQGS